MVSEHPAAFPPAPLRRGALAESLRPFGESRMLPPAAYTDPAVHEWERRHIFGGGWMCAARGAQLPVAGDQFATGGGVLLVRGEDGTARAFANTCRHRGHELLPGGATARATMIVCPYHSWTYSLSGELRGARGLHAAQDRWPLAALPAIEWHGLIFVDMSGGDAGALPLAGLRPLVSPYEPERSVVAATRTYDAAANWKILTENYHECYHCPAIHPELCRVSPPRSGENYAASGSWIGGWMSLRDGAETMSLDGRSGGVPFRGLSGSAPRTVVYVAIFPNVLLSLHPDYIMTHILRPVAADRTVIECSWAFAPEAVARPDFDPGYAADFWDLTNRQDWAACESVQRGLSSPFASAGPLAPDEDAVYSFVTTVARAYLGERVTERPLPEPAGLTLPLVRTAAFHERPGRTGRRDRPGAETRIPAAVRAFPAALAIPGVPALAAGAPALAAGSPALAAGARRRRGGMRRRGRRGPRSGSSRRPGHRSRR